MNVAQSQTAANLASSQLNCNPPAGRCHHAHHLNLALASCLIYSYTLTEYINRFAVDRMVTLFFTMLSSAKFTEEKVLVFFILSEKC